MNCRLHRIHTLFVLLLIVAPVAAQEFDGQKVSLANHRLLFGLTSQSVYDGYVSSVPYDGWGFYLNHTNLSLPISAVLPFLFYQQTEGLATLLVNEAGTANMAQVGMTYTLGALYPFKPFYGLKVAAGGLIGADWGLKQLSRNVNNPYSMDASVDLLAGLTMTYDLPVGRRYWRLKADLKTPLVGVFFAPMRGQSYYEWLTYNQYSRVIHLSSLHNKNRLSMLYTLDLPLNGGVLSLGVAGLISAHETGDLVFTQRRWGLMAGWSMDLAAFSAFPQPSKPGFLRVDR